MNNTFLQFADEIITIANKTHALIYDQYTCSNYSYSFDAEDFTRMNAMEAIAKTYGFSFTPIIKEDDTAIGFKLEKNRN